MNVQGPDGAVIEFPDDMPQEHIRAVMAKRYPPTKKVKDIIPGGQTLSKIGTGAAEGLENIAQGIVNLPGQIVRAPGQMLESAVALAQHPAERLPVEAAAAKDVVAGMIPMRETVTQALQGQFDPQTASREATELAASQILPGAIAGAGKAMVRAMPGASIELHSLAVPRLEALADRYRPAAGAADAAYAKLAEIGNPKLYMGNFRQTLMKLLEEEHIKPIAEQDQARIAWLQQHLNDSAEGWNFNKIKAGSESLGSGLGSFQSNKGAKIGATTGAAARQETSLLNRLYAAIHEDVREARPIVVKEAAQAARPASVIVDEFGQPLRPATEAKPAVVEPGGPTAQTLELAPQWKEASRLARREFASTGLARDIQDAIGTTGEGWSTINVNRLITKIRKARQLASMGNKTERLWVDSFEPRELDDITNTLKGIAHELPVMSKKIGTITGSSQRVTRGLAGAAAGAIVGHGSALATEIGAATAAAIPEMIAQAMMTEPGRALVRATMQHYPIGSPVFRNTMAAFLRTEAEHARGETPHDAIADTPATARPAPAPTAAPTPAPEQFKIGDTVVPPLEQSGALATDQLTKLYGDANPAQKKKLEPYLRQRLTNPADRAKVLQAIRPDQTDAKTK